MPVIMQWSCKDIKLRWTCGSYKLHSYVATHNTCNALHWSQTQKTCPSDSILYSKKEELILKSSDTDCSTEENMQRREKYFFYNLLFHKSSCKWHEEKDILEIMKKNIHKIIVLRVIGLQKGHFHPVYIRGKGLLKLGLKEDS